MTELMGQTPSHKLWLRRLKLYCGVLLGGVVGVLAAVIVRTKFNLILSDADNAVLANYLQVVGSIYGMVIGFVIFVVWNQFTDTERLIDQEVERLEDLFLFAGALALESDRCGVMDAAKAYAQSVLEIEASATLSDRCAHIVNPAWEKLHRQCQNVEVNSVRDQAVYSELLRRIDSLSECRNQRLGILSRRIPWPLWHLLIFVSIVTVIPFCLINIQDLIVDIAVVWSTASAVSFLLLVIYDLDDPFRGVFNVSFEPYRAVLRL